MKQTRSLFTAGILTAVVIVAVLGVGARTGAFGFGGSAPSTTATIDTPAAGGTSQNAGAPVVSRTDAGGGREPFERSRDGRTGSRDGRRNPERDGDDN